MRAFILVPDSRNVKPIEEKLAINLDEIEIEDEKIILNYNQEIGLITQKKSEDSFFFNFLASLESTIKYNNNRVENTIDQFIEMNAINVSNLFNIFEKILHLFKKIDKFYFICHYPEGVVINLNYLFARNNKYKEKIHFLPYTINIDNKPSAKYIHLTLFDEYDYESIILILENQIITEDNGLSWGVDKYPFLEFF